MRLSDLGWDDRFEHAFQQWAGSIKRASGVVLILAGLYLGYYYVAAGM